MAMDKNVEVALMKELEEVATKRFHGELSQHGFIKGMAEELGKKYGISNYTVKNRYSAVKREIYTKLETEKAFAQAKKSHKQEEVIQEKVEEVKEEPKQEVIKQEKKPTYRSHYLIGDNVDVKVKRVEHYGVIVGTNDLNAVQGLIHVTNVQNDFRGDLNDYFKKDQIIKNVYIIGKKEPGNLKLSTKHLRLEKNPQVLSQMKAPFNPLPLEGVKDKIKVVEMPVKKEVVQKTISEKQTEITNSDVGKIAKYISTKVGVVTNKATQEIERIIKEKGVVDFMIASGEVMQDFEVDISMLLVKEIEEKINRGCL